MHNTESVQENKMQKILWDSETQTDHQNLSQTIKSCHSHNKRTTCRIDNFAVSADHRVKLKESEKRDKYQDIARELKIMEHESDGDTNCSCRTRYSHQRIDTKTG